METESDELFIEWDEERYSTAIERFDEQHKLLFELLNDLYAAMKAGQSDEKIGEILRELEAYTEYHFGDEEEFMQDCGFAMDCADCFFNHREMHDDFAEKVTELRRKHEQGEYISMEVLMFARNWLDSHIAGLNQDQSYGEYYQEDVPDDYEYEPGQLKLDRAEDLDPHEEEDVVEAGQASSTDEDSGKDKQVSDEDEQASQTVEPEPITLSSSVHSGGALDVPAESMSSWLEELATSYSTQAAAHVKSGDSFTPWSFDQLYDEAREVAGGLLEVGLEPGDRVGIHLGPGATWSLVDLACYLGGFVSVPVSALYRSERAQHVVRDADISLLISDSALPVSMDDAVETVVDAAELPRAEPSTLPDFDADADDVATIVYRIGTTDHPNGCAITHRNLRAAIEMLRTSLPFEAGQTGTCFLPQAHMYQRVSTYALWDAGGSVAYVDPNDLVSDLRAVEPDILVGVPDVYRHLADEIDARTEKQGGLRQAISDGVAHSYGEAKDRGERLSTTLSLKHRLAERTVFSSVRESVGLGNIEHALTGTEAIDPDLVQFFSGYGVPISEIYGATELSGLATVNRAGSFRAGTVGSPFPGVEVALADDEEVLVRGPNVIEGYWNESGLWRQTLRDGWYLTGDLGSLDEHDALRIRGPK